MDHTHLILEAEMGFSNLLSTIETASAIVRNVIQYVVGFVFPEIK